LSKVSGIDQSEQFAGSRTCPFYQDQIKALAHLPAISQQLEQSNNNLHAVNRQKPYTPAPHSPAQTPEHPALTSHTAPA